MQGYRSTYISVKGHRHFAHLLSRRDQLIVSLSTFQVQAQGSKRSQSSSANSLYLMRHCEAIEEILWTQQTTVKLLLEAPTFQAFTLQDTTPDGCRRMLGHQDPGIPFQSHL